MMNKFSWYAARSVEDAQEKVQNTVSELLTGKQGQDTAVYKAGGIDLLDLMKEGLISPGKIIQVQSIPDLDQITFDEKEGLHIGANATLSALEIHPEIGKYYPALQQAVAHAGTPQLRNLATLGGNLAQRTRCWYFRSIDHVCYRKGSGTCFAQEGQNELHAIIRNQPCASVHSSSVATALLAFNAQVTIAGTDGKTKRVDMEEFFVHPEVDSRKENILEPGELITAVTIAPPAKNTRSHYIKFGARASHDWAQADVAVVMELSGNKCKNAEIALGAAAPVPIKSAEAATLLRNKVIDETLASRAGEVSMQQATPLAHNAYKVPVFKTLVKRAIMKTVES
jgi:xanthine dehydrogenase YagS FAD-binding subunit